MNNPDTSPLTLNNLSQIVNNLRCYVGFYSNSDYPEEMLSSEQTAMLITASDLIEAYRSSEALNTC